MFFKILDFCATGRGCVTDLTSKTLMAVDHSLPRVVDFFFSLCICKIKRQFVGAGPNAIVNLHNLRFSLCFFLSGTE